MPQSEQFTKGLNLSGPIASGRPGRDPVDTAQLAVHHLRSSDPLVMNQEFTVAEGKIAELRIGF